MHLCAPRTGIAGLALLALAAGLPVTANGSDLDVEAKIQLGHDSNPLRISQNEDGGLAASGALEIDYDALTGRRGTFFFELDAERQQYESGLSDADRTDADLAAGFEWVPVRDGARRLTLTLGAGYDITRKTFTSRTTGEVFRVATPAGGVPIPDRFDNDLLEAFFELEWRTSDRFRAFLEAGYGDRDYKEDYDELAGVDRLDNSELRFEPGARWYVGEDSFLQLSYERTIRDYEDRLALDQDGAEAPATEREYRYDAVRLAFRHRVPGSYTFTIGVHPRRRDDTFAGYYDYDALALFGLASVELGERSELSFFGASSSKDYDNATVDREVDGEIRSKDTLLLKGYWEYAFSPRLALELELSHYSSDDVNPSFDYDRSRALLGLVYTP